MSKAFTKDDAPADAVAIVRRDLTDGAENYMTLQGHEAFKRELEQIIQERSEVFNSKATDRDERLRILDERAVIVKNAVDTAKVIDPSAQKGDRVLFGATVTVSDEDGNERVYKIVGVDETNASEGKVSWISPVAKALLQTQEGDAVILKTPQKTEELEVLKIEFKPIV